MNNSAQKIKSKNSGVNYLNKKNNININININNGRFNKAKTNTSNTMINPHVSYDNLDKKEKKEKKNNKKTMKTENNFKAPSNIEKLGKKIIKEEIAQEKKTTVEKLKIIKMHILSLKKKEEELTNKLIKLNNQENALSKNDKDNKEKTENLEKEGKIENIPKIEKEEKNNKNEDKNERDEDKIISDQKEKQNKCENDKKEINNIEKKEEVIDKEKNPNNEKVQKDVKYNDKTFDTKELAKNNAEHLFKAKYNLKNFLYQNYVPWYDNEELIKNESYEYFKQIKPENSVIILALRDHDKNKITCNESCPFYLNCSYLKDEKNNKFTEYYNITYINYTFKFNCSYSEINENANITFIPNKYMSKYSESFLGLKEESNILPIEESAKNIEKVKFILKA